MWDSVATIVVNYCFGRRIQVLAERQAKTATLLLAIAVGVNVGLLGYFKYRNFFMDNLNTLTASHWAIAPLVLPLAIPSTHSSRSPTWSIATAARWINRRC